MNRWHALSDREKRTVRFAGIGLALYLTLFAGYQVWKFLERQRSEYRQLAVEAQLLRQKTLPYQERALVLKKMMEDFHLNPAQLKKASVVADASAAIQQAAKSGGVGLGPIRETPARGSAATLATIQMEGTGQVTAVLSFLAGLNTIGYPLVVDSVQFTSMNNGPGLIKVNLIINVLNFDAQKESKEAPHA